MTPEELIERAAEVSWVTAVGRIVELSEARDDVDRLRGMLTAVEELADSEEIGDRPEFARKLRRAAGEQP